MGGKIFHLIFFCLECNAFMSDWACNCLTFLKNKEICIHMHYVVSRVSAFKKENDFSEQGTSIPSLQSSKIDSIVMNTSTSLTNKQDKSYLAGDTMNNSISLTNNREGACLPEYCMNRVRLFIENRKKE